MEQVHDVHRFRLKCSGWHATGDWTKNVTAAEVTSLVQSLVDDAVAEKDGQSPLGTTLHGP
ncbi:hypothetical protein [Streptomyces sp. NPDC060187]|uniref:hypothetical protein n=1 Tax=Streptomyces sp. NPDC060187 TaxID=3347067 RepID=UPI0036659685